MRLAALLLALAACAPIQNSATLYIFNPDTRKLSAQPVIDSAFCATIAAEHNARNSGHTIAWCSDSVLAVGMFDAMEA